MEKRPESGEWYRDSEDRLYQVVTTAIFTETGEELVVYQALSGDYQVYAGPVGMFLSGEARAKYPQAAQKYRFARVERPGREKLSDGAERSVSREGLRETAAEESGLPREESRETTSEHGGVSPKLMAFFDADDLEEKYHILLSMREEMTDHLINNMAVVLDVVIPEGDIDSRYEELKRCIRTRQRYESDRLR